MSVIYRVYLTPTVRAKVYGDEIDITERVFQNQVAPIVRSIDSEDFGIGVYTHDDVTIQCYNHDGFFNDSSDSRSTFLFSRDLAKIRIEYRRRTRSEDNGENPTDDDVITFRGFINEEATKLNVEEDTISFRILSRDSAIRKSKIPAGSISNGISFKNAMLAILSSSDITTLLNVDADNINPAYNGTIENGADFNNKLKKDSLEKLLAASNSYLFIDQTDTVIVKSRGVQPDSNPVLKLYGKSDTHVRENVLSIKNFNTGLHRTFNSIRVDSVEVNSNPSIVELGTRQRAFDFGFLTTNAEKAAVAQALLNEFKYPKLEAIITVDTRIAKDYDLLSRVSLDYPLRVARRGTFLPVVGVTRIGDVDSPLPDALGSLQVDKNIGFKIIEIRENPSTFTTELKLRQIGTDNDDGYDEGAIDQTFHGEYASQIDADWAEGSTTGTLSGTVSITGNKLDLTSVGYVDYSGFKNASQAIQKGAMRFLFTPDYTGAPAGDTPLGPQISRADNDIANLMRLYHKGSTGEIYLEIYDGKGVQILQYISPAWTPINGQEYELELNHDLEEGEQRIFINGSIHGVVQTAKGIRDSDIGLIRLGAFYTASGQGRGFYRRVKLFQDVQHDADYTSEVSI